jgi:uncharacterized protein
MTEKVPIREGIFKEGPDGGRLIAGKCDSCGEVFFPSIDSCLSCGHDTIVQTELDRKGRLFSYTIVQMPVANFSPPFAVGYVDLAEGIRIFSQLRMEKEKPFQIGMEMELEIDTLWKKEDNDIVGYRFSPV